jgi:hypothetical protein
LLSISIHEYILSYLFIGDGVVIKSIDNHTSNSNKKVDHDKDSKNSSSNSYHNGCIETDWLCIYTINELIDPFKIYLEMSSLENKVYQLRRYINHDDNNINSSSHDDHDDYKKGITARTNINSSSLLDPTRSLLDPTRSHLDPTRSLLDPMRSLLDPTRSLLDPTRSLLDPTRSHLDPTRSHLDPTRSLLDPTRSHLDPTISDTSDVIEPIRPNQSKLLGLSVPSGWCSWYHFYEKITEHDLVANLNGKLK